MSSSSSSSSFGVAASLAALVVLAGCSSSNPQPPLEGTGDDGSAGPAGGNHAPLPQVDDNGGGILTAPLVVTVTFDPSVYTTATLPTAGSILPDLLDFDDTITQSAWWDTIRAGYCEPVGSTNCVGKGTAVDPTTDHVSITTAPAASYTDASNDGPSTLQPYIRGLIAASTLPAPTANTIYVFYFPQSTSITFNGATTCVEGGIGGYHNSLPVGSIDAAYAIIGVCDPEDTAQGTAKLTVEQTATFAASHEIIEASTDPHAGKPTTGSNDKANLGFYMTSDANQAWPLVLGGGEVADLCVDLLGLGQDRSTQGKYTVQRIWNNGSAAGGHNPCVPIPSGEVYFNVAPPTADQEFELGVGKTTTFESIAFADGAEDPWQVELVDIGQNADGTQSTVLTASPSKATATAGDNVACEITLNTTPPVQGNETAGSPGYEPFILASVNAAGQYHLWPGIVAAQQ